MTPPTGAPLLCVLCINPAEDDFPIFGTELPRVRLCRQCHHRVQDGAASVGWCEPGQHYGRARTRCPRHRVHYALATGIDINGQPG
ncbi:hypothetical protein [Pseudonocardia sp. NPDC049154]|uniref:hypothetical protein n=1 Tax=Pseudonocardia sp. NPDC049154 TaxID=3155501 RepID=UPI0033D9374A